jgi:hypothetical protein
MYGLGLCASAEPRRLWPCGDVVIAGVPNAAGTVGHVGYLASSVKNLGSGRWCP